jgi:hypothetical protein
MLSLFVQACALVASFAFCAGVVVVAFNPFHDNYYRRLDLYQQALITLSTKECNNSTQRHLTRDFNGCTAAEYAVHGSSVFGRAIADTVEALHPCSGNRCNSVFDVLVTVLTFFSIFAAFAIFLVLSFKFATHPAVRPAVPSPQPRLKKAGSGLLLKKSGEDSDSDSEQVSRLHIHFHSNSAFNPTQFVNSHQTHSFPPVELRRCSLGNAAVETSSVLPKIEEVDDASGSSSE